MKKNQSIEANLVAAKAACQQMEQAWREWKRAKDNQVRHQCQAKYSAAYTSCKVYIENYLKKLFPNEHKIPLKIQEDIWKIVQDMEAIDKINEVMIKRIFKDIDQLSRDAA